MKPLSAKIIEEATAPALAIETLREQCELVALDSDGHPDDDLLMSYLAAAVDHFERFTGRALLPRIYEFALDDFPRQRYSWLCDPSQQTQNDIEVPYPPLIEVLSFTYADDSDGELEPDEDYTVDTYGDKALLRPVTSWPGLLTADPNRVKCRYRAGYSGEVEPDSDAVSLPAAIRHALLVYVESAHRNRGVVPAEMLVGIEALLRPYRVLLGFA